MPVEKLDFCAKVGILVSMFLIRVKNTKIKCIYTTCFRSQFNPAKAREAPRNTCILSKTNKHVKILFFQINANEKYIMNGIETIKQLYLVSLVDSG